MLLALGDRQAIEVRADAALEHGVAIVVEVMRCDRCRERRWAFSDEIRRLFRRDVLKHDLESREVFQ